MLARAAGTHADLHHCGGRRKLSDAVAGLDTALQRRSVATHRRVGGGRGDAAVLALHHTREDLVRIEPLSVAGTGSHGVGLEQQHFGVAQVDLKQLVNPAQRHLAFAAETGVAGDAAGHQDRQRCQGPSDAGVWASAARPEARANITAISLFMDSPVAGKSMLWTSYPVKLTRRA